MAPGVQKAVFSNNPTPSSFNSPVTNQMRGGFHPPHPQTIFWKKWIKTFNEEPRPKGRGI